MTNSIINSRGRTGLALGSGSSRGWSHIGVIKALSKVGIEPDIICGCSIGALVGASYCAGNLDRLENWVHKLSKMEVARFFELNWSLNGFVDAERLEDFLSKNVCDEELGIEALDKTFAAVSTDLENGREVWFTKGSVLQAVWASMSLPGLFPPIQNDGRWLVDGGLVNPVPVSICRALGADQVIAVNLNGDILGRHMPQKSDKDIEDGTNIAERFVKSIKEYSEAIFPEKSTEEKTPGLFDAIASSINITQDRITRSRMAGDPPDVLLSPKLSRIGLLEFHKASEAIKEGEQCVERMLPEIRYAFSL
ncbi:patatin-like phospholipase RssA [Kaarinaea lacus]